MRLAATLSAVLILAAPVGAQQPLAPAGGLRFESASIEPASDPFTDEPQLLSGFGQRLESFDLLPGDRFEATATLRNLIAYANGFERHWDRATGTAPILDQRFVVSARGAAGSFDTATGDELPAVRHMLQHLLTERFEVAVTVRDEVRRALVLKRDNPASFGPLRPIRGGCVEGTRAEADAQSRVQCVWKQQGSEVRHTQHADRRGVCRTQGDRRPHRRGSARGLRLRDGEGHAGSGGQPDVAATALARTRQATAHRLVDRRSPGRAHAAHRAGCAARRRQRRPVRRARRGQLVDRLQSLRSMHHPRRGRVDAAGDLQQRQRIVQAPGMVVLRSEMIHETRVVYLDGRPHPDPKIRMMMGDSRGHWDGETLVVETTNFDPKTSGVGANGSGRISEELRITERLTRVSPDLLVWRMTFDDPKTWTRPWTIELPLKRDDSYGMFEYACHEGNYALRNILSGARAEDAANAKK